MAGWSCEGDFEEMLVTLTTNMRTWRRALIVSVVSMVVACKGNPNSPSGLSGPFAGSWQGTMTDAAAGVGTVSLTRLTIGAATAVLPSYPYEITGTWHGEFPGANLVFDFNLKGYLQSASSSDGAINLRCDPEFAGPNVFGKTLTLMATVSGNRMSGTTSFVSNCPGLAGGTFELTRK
jgi:hypothetical protein